MYTLGEAARASGKSKPTIATAIKAGRISAGRTADGSYQIDPAELHRVYPMTSKATGNGLQQDTPTDTPVATDGVRGELDKWRTWRTLAIERDETIRDLRTRLDAEAAERRVRVVIDRNQGGAAARGVVKRAVPIFRHRPPERIMRLAATYRQRTGLGGG